MRRRAGWHGEWVEGPGAAGYARNGWKDKDGLPVHMACPPAKMHELAMLRTCPPPAQWPADTRR